MKKLLAILIGLLVLMPAVLANYDGGSVGIIVTPEDIPPWIWLCDDRIVLDDNVQYGRTSDGGDELYERPNNYAFEGEIIEWEVLVMDKNKIEDVENVYAIIGIAQDDDDIAQIQCVPDPSFSSVVVDECNARIAEEDLTGESIDSNTQSYYRCSLVVPAAAPEEYWVSIEAIDATTGDATVIDENEYWYLNPVVSILMDSAITFDTVMPGTMSYSDTFLIQNGADPASGVLLDVFISGTDFTSFDGECTNPFTGTRNNQLVLGDGDSACDDSSSYGGGLGDPFCYYAVNGAYSTGGGTIPDGRADAEGYVGINYGDTFNPLAFYGASNGDDTGYEIMQVPDITGPYFPGNILNPGTDISITFRLALPEPCTGTFDSGSIYIWGEAI